MEDVDRLAERAKQIDVERYRETLERAHRDMFCVIEPISGDGFLGKTMSDAAQAARRVHPDRMTHTMRVGHRAALHFGMN